MATALQIVQKFFPEVKHVTDAGRNSVVEVTKRDTNSATVRNHKACALAVACKRKENTDGVVISVKTAYIVKGDKATRYALPESVSREIVSFDKGGEFSPGNYRMLAPSPSIRIGSRQGGANSKPNSGKPKRYFHKTEGIRSVLGSKEL